MSTKSTILLTNCCHIYRDYFTFDDGRVDMDREILAIDISYGEVEYGEAVVEVEWDSDFAAMIRFMIDKCGVDDIDKFCRQHWIDNNEE